MSWWRRLRHRERLEGDLDRELRDHVERQVADHVRAGLPEDEARRRARLEFGGLDQVKELCRDARGTRWIEGVSRDLRYAVRRLARDRSLVALAVSTLGLGIGLNVTIFTMVHAIFVRGLPYEDPGRLVNVSSARDPVDAYQRVSLPDFEDYRREPATLSGLAAFTVDSRTSLSGDEHGPQPRNSSLVTPNTFGLLGQPVLLGRDFRAADGRRGADGTVILGHHVWRERYGGNPDVVGRIVRVDGEPSTVIGVMPEGVRFPFRAEFWQALRPTEVLERRDARALATVGRLRPGVAIEEARAEIRTIAERLRAQHPATNEDVRATVQSFNDWATGANVRLIYRTLAGAVAFVLLIACANVASLLIARSAQRAHEFAIRFAQGATRWQVVRQLSAESLVLGNAGGLAGLAVAAGGVRLAEVLTRDMGMPPWMAFTIDPPVVAFFIGLCIATTLLFGLAPLLHLARTPVGGLLQEGTRSGTRSLRARRLSSAMLVVEATLALVLLGGTGLMLRSLDKLYRVDLGFDLDRVLYGEVTLPSARYSEPEERVRFVTRLEDRLNASRGVRAASVVTNRSTAVLELAGRPAGVRGAAGRGAGDGRRPALLRVAGRANPARPGPDPGRRAARVRSSRRQRQVRRAVPRRRRRARPPYPGPDAGRAGGPLADHRRHRFEHPLGRPPETRSPSCRACAVPHGAGTLVRSPGPDRERPRGVRSASARRGARARPRPARIPRPVDDGPAR